MITYFLIHKTKIMVSGLITSWQIDGEEVETVTDFIFLGSKIIEDSDCSHEIKRRLLLGRKAMTNLDSILKSRDITLLPKVHIVKAMVFPVVMYGCESWTIRKLRIASLCPMQHTACLGLVHGDDPEGCCGEGGGRGVHVWDRMYTRGGFMSMYGKTNTVL